MVSRLYSIFKTRVNPQPDVVFTLPPKGIEDVVALEGSVGRCYWARLGSETASMQTCGMARAASPRKCPEDGGVGLRLAWEMVHTYGASAQFGRAV